MPDGVMRASPIQATPQPHTLWKDITALTLLSAVLYGVGMTHVGVWTWQEGVRLVTAQDMQRHREWIVPTIAGQPYLAKPPLVYWCQLVFAKLMGQPVSLLHLRLTVALMGWASVILTYLAAKSMFSGPQGFSPKRARDIAWWGSLFLATGILHVRMARTGAVDIAATPFVIAAIWASTLAWRDEQSRQTRLKLVFLACLSIALASLVKGPPTLLTAFGPIIGGIIGWVGSQRVNRPTKASFLIPVMLSLGVLVLGIRAIEDIRGVIGLMLLAGGCAWIGLWLARVSTRDRLRLVLQASWRSQIVLLVFVSMGSFWLWLRLVKDRIGPEAVDLAMRSEIAENLKTIQPEAPIRILEAASYGAGLGSLWAIVGVGVIVRKRDRLTPASTVVLAWVAVSLITFAALSSGNGRYITSVWPGMALLGALGFTYAQQHTRTKWLTYATYFAVLLLATGQTWWYANGRANAATRTTAQSFMHQILNIKETTPSRIASFGFWNGGLDYYAGDHVHAVLREGVRFDSPIPPLSPQQLAQSVSQDSEPWVLLTKSAHTKFESPVLVFQRLGISVVPLKLNPDSHRYPAQAWLLTPFDHRR